MSVLMGKSIKKHGYIGNISRVNWNPSVLIDSCITFDPQRSYTSSDTTTSNARIEKDKLSILRFNLGRDSIQYLIRPNREHILYAILIGLRNCNPIHNLPADTIAPMRSFAKIII